MAFKLTNEQIDKIIATQTAPPTTGDRFLWGKVDRKEKKADKKNRKADDLEARASAADASGKWRKAERLRKRAAKKREKGNKKQQQAQDVKDRPDYWARRDE
tara:strand:- start:685 stop:990 length:306 start_codon:yes stop_codon:yes gene_type:complete